MKKITGKNIDVRPHNTLYCRVYFTTPDHEFYLGMWETDDRNRPLSKQVVIEMLPTKISYYDGGYDIRNIYGYFEKMQPDTIDEDRAKYLDNTQYGPVFESTTRLDISGGHWEVIEDKSVFGDTSRHR